MKFFFFFGKKKKPNTFFCIHTKNPPQFVFLHFFSGSGDMMQLLNDVVYTIFNTATTTTLSCGIIEFFFEF